MELPRRSDSEHLRVVRRDSRDFGCASLDRLVASDDDPSRLRHDRDPDVIVGPGVGDRGGRHFAFTDHSTFEAGVGHVSTYRYQHMRQAECVCIDIEADGPEPRRTQDAANGTSAPSYSKASVRAAGSMPNWAAISEKGSPANRSSASA